MKKIILAFTVLLVIVVAIVIGQNYFRNRNIFETTTRPTATINDKTFQLMLAKTPQEKEIGLSDTENLAENTGMLFLFDSPNLYPFWMKNMKIPIDIIFVNGDEIVTIFDNVQPPQDSTENLIIYRPDEPSDKVLEINAGLSEDYGFKKGDKVTLKNLE